jgi:hypothetical protein
VEFTFLSDFDLLRDPEGNVAIHHPHCWSSHGHPLQNSQSKGGDLMAEY